MDRNQTVNESSEVTREQATALAEIADLELSSERLSAVLSLMSVYFANVRRLRTVDPGYHEPPVITYEDEADE